MGIPAIITVIITFFVFYPRRYGDDRRAYVIVWLQIVILLAALAVVVQEWDKGKLAPEEIVGVAAALCFMIRGRYAAACFMGIAVGLGVLHRIGLADVERSPMMIAVIVIVIMITEEAEKLSSRKRKIQAHDGNNAWEQCNVKVDR